MQKNSNGDNKVSVDLVKRIIQRLVLVIPVEEQSTPLVVEDHGAFVVCNLTIMVFSMFLSIYSTPKTDVIIYFTSCYYYFSLTEIPALFQEV